MFVLSKLLGLLTNPLTVFILAVALGTGLLFTRFARAGRRVLAVTALAMLAVSLFPVDEWLIGPFEDRFPQPVLPERVDGIVVLGGAVNPVMTAMRGQVSMGGAAERITEFIALARRYPQARLAFTGGSGSVLNQELKEAAAVRRLLDEIGFDSSRVVFEAQSRNTRENAVMTKELMAPQPGETWLLVTSALHMPRSVGAFRAVGWPVLPYPVDYATAGRLSAATSVDLRPGRISWLGSAMHEWAGLAYYRWRGWTDALFPGP